MMRVFYNDRTVFRKFRLGQGEGVWIPIRAIGIQQRTSVLDYQVF